MPKELVCPARTDFSPLPSRVNPNLDSHLNRAPELSVDLRPIAGYSFGFGMQYLRYPARITNPKRSGNPCGRNPLQRIRQFLIQIQLGNLVHSLQGLEYRRQHNQVINMPSIGSGSIHLIDAFFADSPFQGLRYLMLDL
jgi:hypothetical protein